MLPPCHVVVLIPIRVGAEQQVMIVNVVSRRLAIENTALEDSIETEGSASSRPFSIAAVERQEIGHFTVVYHF